MSPASQRSKGCGVGLLGSRDVGRRLAEDVVHASVELRASAPLHDLDAVGGIDRRLVDALELEHEPGVPPDLAEAAPLCPGAALLVLLDARCSRPRRTRAARARARAHERGRCRRLGRGSPGSTYASHMPMPGRGVPAEQGEPGGRVHAVDLGEEPAHVVGLTAPVDHVLGRPERLAAGSRATARKRGRSSGRSRGRRSWRATVSVLLCPQRLEE